MARPTLTRFVTSTGAWLDHCHRAERLSLAAIYASDSPGQDGFVGAALALGATNELSVGVAAALPTRSPLQTANAAAELAGSGRIAPVVLAAGNPATTEFMHGRPYSPPVERMRDFYRCVEAVLRAERDAWVEIETAHYHARGPGHGLDASKVPLLLGATSPAMVALAGELADGLMVHLLTPLNQIGDRIAAARNVAKRALITSAGLLVSVDDDEATALGRARAELTAALTLPQFASRLYQVSSENAYEEIVSLVAAGELRRAAATLPEEAVRELILVTTRQRFARELEELPADTVVPVPVGAFMPLAHGAVGKPDDPAKSGEWLARALLPGRV